MPGIDGSSINDQALDGLDLTQMVSSPTRYGNILDLMVQPRESGIIISCDKIDQTGFSDHRLVVSKLDFRFNHRTFSNYKFRKIKSLGHWNFQKIYTGF